jgi:endo-1,4-beta-xylanase
VAPAAGLRMKGKVAAAGGQLLAWIGVSVVIASCGGTTHHLALREAPTRGDLSVGTAVQSGLVTNRPYRVTLEREYDSLSPENELKWASIHPRPDRFAFKQADYLVRYARSHGMKVWGNNLVWGLHNPPWLDRVPASELGAALRSHIRTVVGRYRGRVGDWVVVNEAIEDNGQLRDNVWLRGIGPAYMSKAYRWAHEADPHARLYYNDYGAEGLGPKSDAVYNLVKALKEQGVPIDGVGLEMHITSEVPAGFDRNLERLAALGLDIAITEMDVRLKVPPSASDLKAQAATYASVARSCARQPRCKDFTTWGFTDQYSWIPGVYPGYGAALPFDQRLEPKAAYYAIRKGLEGRAWLGLQRPRRPSA